MARFDPILVEGRLQFRTWEAQDGSKRSKVDVTADNIQFLSGGGGDGSAAGGGRGRREEVDINESDLEDIPFKIAYNAKRMVVRDIL